ncbi:hypothetical protein [Kitasatospora sp. GAS1066B]|uniref:hypothetical protein n=1 Tax=Kitasatospora sp. GAS1066B TaxID=3156271 RepID=UPI003511E657
MTAPAGNTLELGLAQLARISQHPSATARLIIRGLLDAPGTENALAPALTRSDLRPAALEVARALVERRIDAGEPWTHAAADWLSKADSDWRTSARFCNDLAWYARRRGNSASIYLTSADHLTRPGTDHVHAQALVHLQLAALRYDFRCRSIQQLLDQVPESRRAHWDPYTRALRAFALLGQSNPDGLNVMQHSLDEAGDNPQVCHALLHGLWLGDALPGQAEQILRLAARSIFADDDPVMLFRAASALRMLGRRHEALATVENAMEALAPNAPEFHADLVRERTLITSLPR